MFNVILAAFGGVTLIFGDSRDALFLGVIVANATIGIRRRCGPSVPSTACRCWSHRGPRVGRGGRGASVEVQQVVVDDLVAGAGDQVIADGRGGGNDLRLDESILTGESEPAERAVGEEVRSGAFVVEGAGAYGVRAVGEDSFAAQVTGEARSFRHPRSPLERAVNRLLYASLRCRGLGAVLGYSLYHRHVGVHSAVATSTAGVVTLIPEGLMVLVSLTYAAAAVQHVPPWRAGPAAQCDRVAGVSGHDLHRQDRDADRGRAARGRTVAVPGARWRRSNGVAGERGGQRVVAKHHAAGDG